MLLARRRAQPVRPRSRAPSRPPCRPRSCRPRARSRFCSSQPWSSVSGHCVYGRAGEEHEADAVLRARGDELAARPSFTASRRLARSPVEREVLGQHAARDVDGEHDVDALAVDRASRRCRAAGARAPTTTSTERDGAQGAEQQRAGARRRAGATARSTSSDGKRTAARARPRAAARQQRAAGSDQQRAATRDQPAARAAPPGAVARRGLVDEALAPRRRRARRRRASARGGRTSPGRTRRGSSPSSARCAALEPRRRAPSRQELLGRHLRARARAKRSSR